jgi:hypothetical protein
MRSRARKVFEGAISEAYRWLDELLSDPTASIAALAIRKRKSERSRGFQAMRLKSHVMRSETAKEPLSPRKYRGIEARRKPERFGGTGWWAMQSLQTGLRERNSLLTGKITGKFPKQQNRELFPANRESDRVIGNFKSGWWEAH